jgi:hypothetical protein
MEFLLGLGLGVSFGACVGVLVAAVLRAGRDDAPETRLTERDEAALREAAESPEDSPIGGDPFRWMVSQLHF